MDEINKIDMVVQIDELRQTVFEFFQQTGDEDQHLIDLLNEVAQIIGDIE